MALIFNAQPHGTARKLAAVPCVAFCILDTQQKSPNKRNGKAIAVRFRGAGCRHAHHENRNGEQDLCRFSFIKLVAFYCGVDFESIILSAISSKISINLFSLS